MISMNPEAAIASCNAPTKKRPARMVPSPGVARRFNPARAIAEFRSSFLFFATEKIFIHERQRADAERQRNQKQKLSDQRGCPIASLHRLSFVHNFHDLSLVGISCISHFNGGGPQFFKIRPNIDKLMRRRIDSKHHKRQKNQNAEPENFEPMPVRGAAAQS